MDTPKVPAIVLGEETPVRVLQVSGTTNPKQLAGSLAQEVRSALEMALVPNLSLHAIGHHAVGQGLKAIPILNGMVANRGLVFTILPTFEDRQIDEGGTTVTRTVMRLQLKLWRIGA